MTQSKTSAALQAEANEEQVPVEFRGNTYVVPGPMDWPLEVPDLLAEGRISLALSSLLGDEQFTTFKGTKPRVRDALALMEAIAAASGTSLGN